MEKRLLILTGSPGAGKTTVFTRTVEALRAQGYSVGGMTSREVRRGEIRVGFEIEDLTSGKKGWLSHAEFEFGPRVGRYHVNLEDLDKVGTSAILTALNSYDVLAIDEIGPMELLSQRFKEAAQKVLDSNKAVLAVVHQRAKDKLAFETKNREDAEVLTVTAENRDTLSAVATSKVVAFLERCR